MIGVRGAARLPERSPAHVLVRRLIDRWGNEQGQGLVEYALILFLIAIVAIIALVFLGNTVSTQLSKVGASV